MSGRAVTAGSVLAGFGLVQSLVNARLLRRPAAPSGPLPRVSVLVPARDEQDVIARCAGSLVGQGSELLVLDDGSSDDTAPRAAAAGARVLSGAPLPGGWLGKPWACAQLAAAADPASEVLVFVDADVRVAPGAVPAAVAVLRSAGLDVVCPFPRQEASTAAERLVQPLLQWSWLTTLPLRVAERSPRPSLAAACGQFVVIRRDALHRAGGFAAVRGEVLDDVALVRAVKASGGRGGVIDGTVLASCRMYAGWPALRAGYGKWLWSAFGSPGRAVAVVAGSGLVYVLPAVAALRGSRVGLLGYLAGVASRMVAARRTGGRVSDSAAHPVSVILFGWLTLRSVWLRRRGTLTWKGRPIG